MKIYEKKEVSVIKETLTKIECDICGKDINTEQEHYEVTTGHHDWGNDSCESIENIDVCSDECLQKEFNSYLKYESSTKYIEIERI
jgi:hypothetical protein